MNISSWQTIPIEQREQMITTRWGAPIVISRGVTHFVPDLPGLAVWDGDAVTGLVTYCLSGDSCELVTIDSFEPGKGIGSLVMQAFLDLMKTQKCRRVWLITTNDNLNALRFYQKRGFVLSALYRDAITQARQQKPQIPLLGNDDIPLRDELELEYIFPGR